MRVAFPAFSIEEIKRDFPVFALMTCIFGDKQNKYRVKRILSAMANRENKIKERR